MIPDLLPKALGTSLLAVGFIAGHVGEIFIIVGIVVFAIATWRSRSPEILRKENEDLRNLNRAYEERLGRLEKDLAEARSKIAALEAMPNLDSIAAKLDTIAAAVLSPNT